MKKLPRSILFLSLLALASCRETWTTGTKNRFHEGCMEKATGWAGGEAAAKTYCDCVLDKMMQKYPHEDDALEHLDSLAKDPDLINCRQEIEKK